MCLKEKDFKDFISRPFHFGFKVESFEIRLKIWNKEVLDNVSIKEEMNLHQMGFWDSKEREGPPFLKRKRKLGQ